MSHAGLVIASEKCFFVKQKLFICNTSAKHVSQSHQTLRKKFPHHQCHIKEQYTKQWKNYKSQIQCWTKIKYKNWYFSWLMHGVLHVSIQIEQKKKLIF